MATATRTVRAPRGTSLACNGWQQDAALRMLSSTLDRRGAERPDDFIGHANRLGPTVGHWPTGPGGMDGGRPPTVIMNDAGALVIGVDPGTGPFVVVVSRAEEHAC